MHVPRRFKRPGQDGNYLSKVAVYDCFSKESVKSRPSLDCSFHVTVAVKILIPARHLPHGHRAFRNRARQRANAAKQAELAAAEAESRAAVASNQNRGLAQGDESQQRGAAVSSSGGATAGSGVGHGSSDGGSGGRGGEVEEQQEEANEEVWFNFEQVLIDFHRTPGALPLEGHCISKE